MVSASSSSSAELDQDLEVVDPRVQPVEPVELGLLARDSAAGDLLGVLGVVPQVGGGGLLLEVGDLGLSLSRSVTSRTESMVWRRSLISCAKSTATVTEPTRPRPAAGPAHAAGVVPSSVVLTRSQEANP